MAEKWTIQTLGEKLSTHIAKDEDRDKKLDKLYSTVVVGNGAGGFTTTVSKHADWIAGANKFIWAFVLSILGVIVTSAGSLIYMIYRIYPILQQIEKLEPLSRAVR